MSLFLRSWACKRKPKSRLYFSLNCSKMMKISVVQLGVILVVLVILFFTVQIIQVAAKQQAANHQEVPTPFINVPVSAPTVQAAPAPVRTQEPIQEMPDVPAQTEEDLKMEQPLQRSPPATQYDPPEATDPLNSVVHRDAEFGSNLRHPEQMIERRAPPSMRGAVASGIASQRSSPGANNAQGYETEMVQNGGDFMGQVLAFDMSEVGSAYSLL